MLAVEAKDDLNLIDAGVPQDTTLSLSYWPKVLQT